MRLYCRSPRLRRQSWVKRPELHLGDGNEQTGARKIDKSWAEAIKILLRYELVDEDAIACALAADESTLALLYFNLHFYLIRKSREWIHEREPIDRLTIRARPAHSYARDFGTRSTNDIRAR